jgi:hypothetical protein
VKSYSGTTSFFPAGVCIIISTARVRPQSDKIRRIDLQDDHESCHPVGLRMT